MPRLPTSSNWVCRSGTDRGGATVVLRVREEARPGALAGPSGAASPPPTAASGKNHFPLLLTPRVRSTDRWQVGWSLCPGVALPPAGDRAPGEVRVGRGHHPLAQCGRPLPHVSLQQDTVGFFAVRWPGPESRNRGTSQPLLSAHWLRSSWPKRNPGPSSESLWQ